MNNPLFPNVPTGAGIPPVLRSGVGIVNNVSLLIADANLFFSQRPQWGIFDDQGAVLLEPDSFISFASRQGWNVPDYPIEEGGFASFNKVIVPADARLVITKGGDAADRAGFNNELAEVSDSLTLIMIQDPEGLVGPFTVIHFDLERKHNEGVSLFTYEIFLRAINIVPVSDYQNTRSPSGANPQNGGTVQPAILSPAEVASANMDGV